MVVFYGSCCHAIDLLLFGRRKSTTFFLFAFSRCCCCCCKPFERSQKHRHGHHKIMNVSNYYVNAHSCKHLRIQQYSSLLGTCKWIKCGKFRFWSEILLKQLKQSYRSNVCSLPSNLRPTLTLYGNFALFKMTKCQSISWLIVMFRLNEQIAW